MVELKGFIRNVGILAGGTAIGQGISLVAAPFLTRLYSVNDFGQLQVYLSVLGFVVVVVAWRYELAILPPHDDEVAANVTAVALTIVVCMCVSLAAIAVYVSSSSLTDETDFLRACLWLLPISALGAGIYGVLNYWCVRQRAYKEVASSKLSQAISQISTQLILGGFFKSGVVGLLVGDAVGRMNAGLGLGRVAWKRNRNIFLTVGLPGMRRAAARYRHFPLVSSGSALLNTAGFFLPSLLMAQLYGAEMLGWFALVERVVGGPSVLIGQGASQVYMGEAARLAKSDPKSLHVLFLSVLKQLLYLGALPCATFIIAGPTLFSFIFGEPWREAGNYARLLAIMHFMGFVTWPLIPTLNLLEKQSWQLGWDIGRLSLTLASVGISYELGWPAWGAVTAFGSAMFAAYASHLLLSNIAILKRIKEVQSSKPVMGLEDNFMLNC